MRLSPDEWASLLEDVSALVDITWKLPANAVVFEKMAHKATEFRTVRQRQKYAPTEQRLKRIYDETKIDTYDRMVRIQLLVDRLGGGK